MSNFYEGNYVPKELDYYQVEIKHFLKSRFPGVYISVEKKINEEEDGVVMTNYAVYIKEDRYIAELLSYVEDEDKSFHTLEEFIKYLERDNEYASRYKVSFTIKDETEYLQRRSRFFSQLALAA